MNYAFIAHSIKESDAHMVYELGSVVENQGLPPEYWYEHQGTQYAFDKVQGSNLYIGLITSARHVNTVIQLWQYARSQGLSALLMVERGINLPSAVSRDPNVLVFRRFAPENPIRFVEMYFSMR
ncbi:MAG: hypothetical protein AAF570_00885 [Bacteroidota bacterium]